ncbi:MAG: hypothetical protein JRL30_01335 [Deltaproteobacteria bacterium]|nr:hypothetical protein [Deltaproteobacteria bacterium]
MIYRLDLIKAICKEAGIPERRRPSYTYLDKQELERVLAAMVAGKGGRRGRETS